ncbi:ArsR/SmtB family transcription factor [Humisphaera borealis]|uniref:Helix-turn-helix transcriptional regulator n=1 Tax=Humisphaera borealis TaxID=2807512 RepID=A0A7M2WUX3_9BACT|nr:metalloregulator ArsR/SmtB family transcription factor [Humisphaera borealis]QOV89213.1 helix-turn-helix transcriptional regulator [Humisphaera borealis]
MAAKPQTSDTQPNPRRAKSAAAHKPLGHSQLAAVAELFGVLAEPTRLRILQMLQRGPANVGQIVEALGIKQANASKQLGVLATAGIVGRSQDGNRVIYHIAMPLVFDLCALVCNGVAEQARQRADALGS